MCGHMNEKMTMMNAFVKQAKDAVLEKFMEGQNEDASEGEEEEITRLTEEALLATDDTDLKEARAKPKKGKSKTGKAKADPKGKSKAKSVDEEDNDNGKPPVKTHVNAAASSSKVSKPIDKPITVGSDGKEDSGDDVPLKIILGRRTVVNLEDEQEITGKGKKPAGSKAAAKRKASDVDADAEEASTNVKGKEAERAVPPPSKKAKPAEKAPPSKKAPSKKAKQAEKSSTSRIMQEGPAWADKKKSEAAAAAAASSGTTKDATSTGTTKNAMSSGTTNETIKAILFAAGTSFFFFIFCSGHLI